MPTQLIELEDGTLIEVDHLAGAVQKTAGGSAIQHVDKTIDRVTPVLARVGQAVAAAWRELNKDMTITETQIELGLSFEGEGNVYVTKATAGANLVVTLTLKPPDSEKSKEDAS